MDWSDHALWWPHRNSWLTRTRSTLDQYGVQADAKLQFTRMHKTARIQLPDLRYVDMRVDFSIKTFNAVIQICKELSEYLTRVSTVWIWKHNLYTSMTYSKFGLLTTHFPTMFRYKTPGRIVPEQTTGAIPSEAQHERNAIQRGSNASTRHQLVCRQQPEPVWFHRQFGHDIFAFHMRSFEKPFYTN